MGLTSSYCVQTLGEKNTMSPKSSSLGYICLALICFYQQATTENTEAIVFVQIFFSCWTFDSPQFKRQLDCGTLYFFNFSWLPSDVEQLSDWNQDLTFLLYYVPHETGSASLKNASVLVEAKPRVLVLHQAWADPVTARFAPFLKQKKSASPDLIWKIFQTLKWVITSVKSFSVGQIDWWLLSTSVSCKTKIKKTKNTHGLSECGIFWDVKTKQKKTS